MKISCFQLPELEWINHSLSQIPRSFIHLQCVLSPSLASNLGYEDPEKNYRTIVIASEDPLVQDLAN